jgi:hypothetical protein
MLHTFSQRKRQDAEQADEVLNENNLDRRKASSEVVNERACNGKKEICDGSNRNPEF